MNNLYSPVTYFKLKKDYKEWLIISILLFIIGLSLLFLSAFIINHKNVLYINADEAEAIFNINGGKYSSNSMVYTTNPPKSLFLARVTRIVLLFIRTLFIS